MFWEIKDNGYNLCPQEDVANFKAIYNSWLIFLHLSLKAFQKFKIVNDGWLRQAISFMSLKINNIYKKIHFLEVSGLESEIFKAAT